MDRTPDSKTSTDQADPSGSQAPPSGERCLTTDTVEVAMANVSVDADRDDFSRNFEGNCKAHHPDTNEQPPELGMSADTSGSSHNGHIPSVQGEDLEESCEAAVSATQEDIDDLDGCDLAASETLAESGKLNCYPATAVGTKELDHNHSIASIVSGDCDRTSETMVDATSSSPSLFSQSSSTDSSAQGELTLLSLPGELLLKIFDYLKARVLLRELSLVCKALNRVISRNVEWKVRYRKRFRGTGPVVPGDDDEYWKMPIAVDDDEFDWKLACLEREDTQWRWAGREARMEHFSLTMAHIAAIDCVHLMHNAELCFTGSRDRSFQLWDLRKLDANNPENSVKAARSKDMKGHKGWVWDMTSLDNNLCTASWDCWMKIWDVNSDLRLVNKLKGRSAFLSVVYQRDAIIAGAYDKSIYVFDPRVDGGALVNQPKHHKRPVLTVVADENYIISGSEDKTIAIFDRRANKVYKKLEVDSFCMCMSYGHGQLWTGHRDGNIHVIDGSFDIVQTYDVGHRGKITDIIHTMGALYTCSTDSTIRISEPFHSPETIHKISTHTRDLTALDLQCGVLASACSDLTAGIWRPISDEDD